MAESEERVCGLLKLRKPLGHGKGSIFDQSDQVHSSLVLLAFGDRIVAVWFLDFRHFVLLFYDERAASAFTIRIIPIKPMLFPIESSRPNTS